jgi:hypothetical protein
MKLNLLSEARITAHPQTGRVKRGWMPDLTTAPTGNAKTGAEWNSSKPADALPLPAGLEKQMIEDVQWDAAGRAPELDEETQQMLPGDPRVGVQIGGVRKTKSGYVYNGWWYVLKLVHPAGQQHKSHGIVQGIQEYDIYYWYRARRKIDPNTGRSTKDEQYVGKILKDIDTKQRIIIPEALKDELDRKVERIWHEQARKKRAKKREESSVMPFPGGMTTPTA